VVRIDCHFTKKDRLRKRKEFLDLSKTGNTVHVSQFLAVFASNSYDRTRLGITVSRKVGNSVVRNRIKRHVREYFRKNRHTFQFDTFRDINLIAKKRAAELDACFLYRALNDIFRKISTQALSHQ
jgi:ribonuclease P protein component